LPAALGLVSIFTTPVFVTTLFVILIPVPAEGNSDTLANLTLPESLFVPEVEPT
jgi:hypothetical protein